MRFKISIALLVLFHPLLLPAEGMNYFSFNERFGLEVNTIYDLLQDGQQTYWLGTDQGLICYDGGGFKTFAPEGVNPELNRLQLDEEGRVWASNFGGQLFRVEGEELVTVMAQSPEKSFIHAYVPLSDSCILYTGYLGKNLRCFNPLTQEDVAIFSGGAFSSVLGLQVYEDGIRFQMEKSFKAKAEKTTVKTYLIKEDLSFELESELEIEKASSFIRAHNIKGKPVLMYANFKGLFIYDLSPGGGLLGKLPYLHSNLNAFSVWNGQLMVHVKDRVVVHDLFSNLEETIILNRVNSSCYLVDHEGNMWLGTLDKGIFIIPNPSFRFQELGDQDITEYLKAPNGDLYFFTEGGKFGWSPFPYRDWVYLREGFGPGLKKRLFPKEGLIYFSDKSFVYDFRAQAFKTGNDATYFRDILILGDGNFLFTGGQLTVGLGPNSVDSSRVRFPFQLWDPAERYPFDHPRWCVRPSRCRVMDLDQDRSHLYVSFVDGVMLYTAERPPEALQLEGKPLLVREMRPDPVKGMWMLTESWELLKVEGSELVFREPLFRNVKQITTDGEFVFFIRNGEVVRFSLNDQSFFTIDYTDGLMEDELVDLHLIGDTLYLLGKKLVQRFPKTYAFRNPVPPQVEIEAVHLFDEPLAAGVDLDFSSDENFLTFYFHALAVRAQEQLAFEYRILGSREDWQFVPAGNNYISFPQLSPGSYTFQLRGLNEDGVASEIAARTFVIHAPVYERWWFLGLVIGLGLLLVGLGWRYRMGQVRKEQQVREEKERLLREVSRSKIAALRSQMNPHFIFNALNTIQEFIITQHKEVASEYLADFAELMRSYLEQSKHEEISLAEEIETLEIYLKLEGLRFDGALGYSISCGPGVEADAVFIPVMLLQPFVENAIKHGLLHKVGEKRLSVKFRLLRPGRLACVVEDNGIGREAAGQVRRARGHAGFATEAMQRKVALVNQTTQRELELVIEDLMEGEEPSGTRVTILLDV